MTVTHLAGLLTFEPESHTYAYGGEKVPSVTKIIRPIEAYYRAPEGSLRTYADRGSNVHALTETWDVLGDINDVPPEYAGYLKGWTDFRSDFDFQPTHIEHRLFHPIYRYAGTADRFGRVRGEMAVIDIKTSAKLGPAIGVQLEAYRQAGNHELGTEVLKGRYAVQLHEDGTYTVKEYDDPHDWQVFLACIALYDWQEKHKRTVRLVDVRQRVDETGTWANFTREAMKSR